MSAETPTMLRRLLDGEDLDAGQQAQLRHEIRAWQHKVRVGFEAFEEYGRAVDIIEQRMQERAKKLTEQAGRDARCVDDWAQGVVVGHAHGLYEGAAGLRRLRVAAERRGEGR